MTGVQTCALPICGADRGDAGAGRGAARTERWAVFMAHYGQSAGECVQVRAAGDPGVGSICLFKGISIKQFQKENVQVNSISTSRSFYKCEFKKSEIAMQFKGLCPPSLHLKTIG